MRLVLLPILAAACSPIYTSQYDDRAGELEEHRTEFLPAANQTKRIGSGQKRVFWIDVARPSEDLVLHSQLPSAPGSRIDYQPKLDDGTTDNEIAQNEITELHFGEQIWADCSFGRSFAYDATMPSRLIASTDMGADDCQVDGNIVWFLSGNVDLKRWDPVAGEPVDVFNFRTTNQIENQVEAFGVIGNIGVAIEEDGDVYKLDIAAKTATWLQQKVPVGGSSFFDEHGIVYDAGDELRYIGYDDPTSPIDISITDAIADSGYHLNFKNDDVQTPQTGGDYVIQGRHLVYRGRRGVFAYGLDTHNVVDLLLDRGEGFEADTVYHDVSVARDANGFLFVRNDNGINSDDHQVYEVDLTDRLK